MRDDSRRQDYIDGLRELANFLAANPDVPDNGGHGTRAQYSVAVWFPGEAAGVAEVNRVAKALDVTPGWNKDRTQYFAQLDFGPHNYCAVWCRPDEEEDA